MAKNPGLEDLITADDLRIIAGDRYFERGEDYCSRGAVTRLRVDGERITARIEGTDTYTSKLWNDQGELGYDCSCPLGEDGEFCKHLVATGLAWLERRAGASSVEGASEADTIRHFLQDSDKSVLVDLLIEQAMEDDALTDRLLHAAQRRAGVDRKLLEQKIRDAFAVRGFVDYKHMPAFAGRAAMIPEFIAEVLRQGDARATAELAAYGIHRALAALQRADDSDGRLGDVVREMVELFRSAVKRRGLPAATLARTLFDLQLADGFGFLTLEAFVAPLGKDGLAAYRKLAAVAWAKVPARGAGARCDDDNGRRYTVSAIVKELARRDGDTDALVDVLSRDLSRPWTYLEIAEALHKAGRHDEALDWAEQGHKAYPGENNAPLEDFLCAEYHRRKRHDDALAMRWARFERHPSLPAYQQLKESAVKDKAWSSWRKKAIDVLEAGQKKEAANRSPRGWPVHAHNGVVLVEVYLWESEIEAALNAARRTPCPTTLWLQLARALEATHLDEAVEICQAQIEPIVRMTSNDAYDHAADVIGRIRELMTKAGRAAEFRDYVLRVRAEHKAKRNFMKRLERFSKTTT